MLRHRLRKLFAKLYSLTNDPPPDQSSTIRHLARELAAHSSREADARTAYMQEVGEVLEARAMVGAGPWSGPEPETLRKTELVMREAKARFGQPVQEAAIPGANGEVELMFQNIGWQRENQLDRMEFSRWGIQQIILICRLYYVKHPWIRRGVNLSASYVFGQGVELSSPDPAANDVLKDFRERNKSALGQIALVEQEKRKAYDGNVFWVLFPDKQDKGAVSVRVVDTTEIEEIITDPEDAETPWYYRRIWMQRELDQSTAQFKNVKYERWYPALNYEPEAKPAEIGGKTVAWDSPIYHRKVGHVASWRFGCPRVQPAVDWSREGKKILTACASVTAALSQIAIDIETKGGQQVVASLKEQMGTGVGPTSSLMDINPPAISGSMFAHGPGMALKAFKARGQGTDPSEVKEYRNMAACALEIPPTWLGDMETSNLATAQTLDRPTELGFLLKQEEWQEDLVVMGIYALRISRGAPSGRLREAKKDCVIREAARVQRDGHWFHVEAAKPDPKVVEVLCNFPAIRQGDIPAMVTATVEAMTLANKSGMVVGIDARAGVRKLYDLLGIDGGDELTDLQYPDGSYDPERSPEDLIPPAIPKALPANPVKEAARIRKALKRIDVVLAARENADAQLTHA
jgi:hypothetical protein